MLRVKIDFWNDLDKISHLFFLKMIHRQNRLNLAVSKWKLVSANRTQTCNKNVIIVIIVKDIKQIQVLQIVIMCILLVSLHSFFQIEWKPTLYDIIKVLIMPHREDLFTNSFILLHFYDFCKRKRHTFLLKREKKVVKTMIIEQQNNIY